MRAPVPVRAALVAVALVLAGFPVTFATTLALLPLWRWVEAATGREAVGHAGPAAWCFWTVYAAWLLLAASVALHVWPYGPRDPRLPTTARDA